MLLPDDVLERELADQGFVVAGVDEVGRGAWAGPASVGVALFPAGVPAPEGVCDSKAISEDQREALFPLVASWCLEWSVGHAAAEECDRLGMTAALRLAARRALDGLSTTPHAVLLDGAFDYLTDPEPDDRAPDDGAPDDGAPDDDGGDRGAPTLAPEEGTVHGAEGVSRTSPVCAVPPPTVRTVVRGDAACVSIAAASILAKVTRDRMMRSFAPSFPAFDFDRNKGYPTPVHRRALAGFGLTSLHRRSWSFAAELAFR